MQKIAFLLEITGLGEGFHFEYKHFGPYSDELADAMKMACAFRLISVEDHETNWGGWYSVYCSAASARVGLAERNILASEAAKFDPVELELAATAAFIAAVERSDDPWGETERRKPEKATVARLQRAKAVYRHLAGLKVPKPLPAIA
jgi:hypothetical protein